jgi:putative membrane protein
MATLDLKQASEKTLALIVYALSIVVVSLVAFLIFFPQVLAIESGINVSYLPKFHAFINGTCAVLLVVAYFAIRSKNIALHKTLMMSTFVLSSIFLISYVIYHSQAPATKFGGEGAIRYFYFFVLISHIILAAIILPLALFTIARSWRGEFDKHKKIARWTLPLWLYVAVTGVLVYVLISPYYNFPQ